MDSAAKTKMDPLDMAVCIGIARGAAVSESALRVLAVLKRLNATAPGRAVPDHEIAREAAVPCRNVIELVEELVRIDVAVLATCGKRGNHRLIVGATKEGDTQTGATQDAPTGKGRFICTNPAMVREYAEKLHRRAKSIHGRAAQYRDLAERMDARMRPVDSQQQGRLQFA